MATVKARKRAVKPTDDDLWFTEAVLMAVGDPEDRTLDQLRQTIATATKATKKFDPCELQEALLPIDFHINQVAAAADETILASAHSSDRKLAAEARRDAQALKRYLRLVCALVLHSGCNKMCMTYHALVLGRAYERLMEQHIYFETDATRGRATEQGSKTGSDKRRTGSQALHRRINAAVDEKLRKRGTSRQPSLTAIRNRVAEDLRVSYRTVLKAQKSAGKK